MVTTTLELLDRELLAGPHPQLDGWLGDARNRATIRPDDVVTRTRGVAEQVIPRADVEDEDTLVVKPRDVPPASRASAAEVGSSRRP
jgi:hypothetical protein